MVKKKWVNICSLMAGLPFVFKSLKVAASETYAQESAKSRNEYEQTYADEADKADEVDEVDEIDDTSDKSSSEVTSQTNSSTDKMTISLESTSDLVTIAVDAEDNTGTLTYSLDSTDPNSFGTNPEFNVPVGTSHIIYVKDAAGNMTYQTFEASLDSSIYTGESVSKEVEEPEVTNPVGIVENSQPSEISTNTYVESNVPVYDNNYSTVGDTFDFDLGGSSLEYVPPTFSLEDGRGNVYVEDKGSSNDFYTITTREGKIFYLAIDNSKEQDNVYLLSQVDMGDLEALAKPTRDVKDEIITDYGNHHHHSNTHSYCETCYPTEVTKKDSDTGFSMTAMVVATAVICLFLSNYYHVTYKSKKEKLENEENKITKEMKGE